MNKEICNKVLENKERFIPHLFTLTQISLLESYLKHKKLTRSEKTYLYSTIKKKMDALTLLREEYYIQGSNMIPERVEQAKQILKGLNQPRAFISGSFLFKPDYGDVDIYILAKKRMSQLQGNKHLMYITEKNLRHPIFFSSLQYSVATFSMSTLKPDIKMPKFNELIMAYEMAINEILDNDDQKMVRDLLFEYHLQIKHVVLDSYSLHQQFEEVKTKDIHEKITMVNALAKELLLKIYSKKYLYHELGPFIKNLQETIKEYKTNDNILIYAQLLGEVKDECIRAEA